MLICFQILVFSTLLNVAFSEDTDKETRVENKNIFFHPIKAYMEPCRTSLGEHGVCLPLNHCLHLWEYAERGYREQLIVMEDFDCGSGDIIFVCCTADAIDPPITPSFISSQRPPDWSGASTGISNTGYGGQVHANNQQGFHSRKPSRGEFHGEEGVGLGFHNHKPNNFGSGGFNEPNSQTSFGGRPSSGSNFEQPDVFGRPANQGFANGGQLERPTNQGFGSGGHLERPTNQGFGSGGNLERPTNQGFGSGGNLERPTNQGFGSGGNLERPTNQGFGSGGNLERPTNQGFGSGGNLERPTNQGFGSGGNLERPTNQGFTNGGNLERPTNHGFGQNGGNSQNSQLLGGSDYERPSQESHSRPFKPGSGNNRPGSQSFGSSGPYDQNFGTSETDNYGSGNGRPNKDKNRPGNSRPGNKRPTNTGGFNEQGSFGSDNFMSGQRPNNGGSQRQHPNRRLLPDGNCGIEISDKIIGGTDANLDEFPWMALLHFSSRSGQDRGHGCGGSLISDRYVLTAAHCIKGPSLPKNTIVNAVRLGEYDLTKERDCVNGVCSPPPIDAAVESVIVHPDYKSNDRGQLNDIALIRLKKKVNFNSYVSPICLPRTEQKSNDFSGKKLIVSGWGKTANGVEAQSSAIKQKVSLPFVSTESCKPFYENINIHLRNTQICAGGEKDRDSCQGDSGGPLMSNEMANGQPSWFVTGIVSFGPENCGLKNIAGVYTKVSEYLDWILDNMQE